MSITIQIPDDSRREHRRHGATLCKHNYLSEFSTAVEKKRARTNLCIDAKNTPYSNERYQKLDTVEKALDYLLEELEALKKKQCCCKKTPTATEAPKCKKTIILEGDNLPNYTITINGRDYIVRGRDREIEITDDTSSFIVSKVTIHADYFVSELVNGFAYPHLFELECGKVKLTPNAVQRSCSTTTKEPTCGNCPKIASIFHGTTNEITDPNVFKDMPIKDIMALKTTVGKTLTGKSLNSFEVPQHKTITYLLVPRNVELVKAFFESNGFITTYFDNTLQSIDGETTNGAFYSRYTRGGDNQNVGGKINGIQYDVYFALNPGDSVTEPIRVQAKIK